MKVLMTGATGLVGTALVDALLKHGHTVCRLMRRESVTSQTRSSAPAADPRLIDVPWDPEASGSASLADSQSSIAGTDAVVNLAGASIAGEPWTQQRKMVLRSSRVKTTRGLVNALAKMNPPPRVLISASAIGYYGNRGDEVLTEDSRGGDDFLARVALEWEAEALKTQALGTRVALARFGIILAKHGGALPQMMRPFMFFAGGRMGSGQQWISWVTLDDVVGILRYALDNASVSGAVNVVAPQPMRNAEFAKDLGRAMHRPALFPAPAFALRLALGQEMADSMLLASQRVQSARLQQLQYRFLHESLPEALASVLNAGRSR
jgi:uncharacterized protein (TIGR01777 family)